MNVVETPAEEASPQPAPLTNGKAEAAALKLEVTRAKARAAIETAEASQAAAVAKKAKVAERAAPKPRLRIATDGDDAWRAGLILKAVKTPEGFIKDVVMAVLPNVVTVLRYHPAWAGVLAWDAFGERVTVTRDPPWDESDRPSLAQKGAWADTDLSRVVDWLGRHEGIHVPTGMVAEALGVVAESNRIHPVIDYLEGLPAWDGVPRLATLLSTYAGAAQTDYSAAIGTRWMISAIARIMLPGCQVDCMLILQGEKQGTGKSRFFREIVPSPSMYSETGIAIGDKDSYQALHGVWIYLFDELDSLKRGELTRAKNFLSSPKDHYRQSYARSARDFPRQNVFGGTTNEREPFTDRTGNRRFWPSQVVGPIDYEGLGRDRDLLWAEALHRFRNKEPWHVDTAELRELCEGEQLERVHADVWEPVVEAWLRDPDHEVEYETERGTSRRREPFQVAAEGPSTAELLIHALKTRPEALNRAGSMRAAEVLRTLGYTVITRKSEGDARVRRYAKPPSASAAEPNLSVPPPPPQSEPQLDDW